MPMDPTEHLVYEHLCHRGFQHVVYEPDGNVAPDFSVDGRLAVEARRLNQHDQSAVPRGLEETAIPFERTVRRVLADFGPPRRSQSWYVVYRFQRPIPEKRLAVQALRQILEEFATGAFNDTTEFVRPTANLTVSFLKAGKPHRNMYVTGAVSDHDAGGFVVSELIRNLAICVAQKTKRVAPFRSRYPEWWLAFVDHISYGDLEDDEVQALRDEAQEWNDGHWDRVVLINPLNPARFFDI